MIKNVVRHIGGILHRLEQKRQYNRAKRSAISNLKKGMPLGGRPISRDELHERGADNYPG